MAPSAVWIHFKKVTEDNKVKAECNICKVKLTYNSATTNLRNHLTTHKIELPKLPAKGGRKRSASVSRSVVTVDLEDGDADDPEHDGSPQSPSPAKRPKSRQGSFDGGPMDKCLNNLTSFSNGGRRDAECTNALLYMIAKDNMPLSTPERPGFRAFVNTVQPLYKIPSEPTITKLLEEKYELLRGKVSKMMSAAEHISLTMDIWTHKYTVASYLGVTAHFTKGALTKSVELGTRLLE